MLTCLPQPPSTCNHTGLFLSPFNTYTNTMALQQEPVMNQIEKLPSCLSSSLEQQFLGPGWVWQCGAGSSPCCSGEPGSAEQHSSQETALGVVLCVPLVTEQKSTSGQEESPTQTKRDVSLGCNNVCFLMMAVGSCSKVWAVTVPEEMAAYR